MPRLGCSYQDVNNTLGGLRQLSTDGRVPVPAPGAVLAIQVVKRHNIAWTISPTVTLAWATGGVSQCLSRLK
jgi:hypothetical protein